MGDRRFYVYKCIVYKNKRIVIRNFYVSEKYPSSFDSFRNLKSKTISRIKQKNRNRDKNF